MTDLRDSPEYLTALLQLHYQAALDEPPRFQQVDVVECEDGRTIMLYAHSPDGRTYCKSFEPPTLR